MYPVVSPEPVRLNKLAAVSSSRPCAGIGQQIHDRSRKTGLRLQGEICLGSYPSCVVIESEGGQIDRLRSGMSKADRRRRRRIAGYFRKNDAARRPRLKLCAVDETDAR